MSKRIAFSLVILSILAFLFTSAFKPAPRPVDVTLLSVSYKREKGVTFKFLVDGNVRKSDLKGKVYVSNKALRLYCNYAGDPTPTTVTCTSQKATVKYAGRPAMVVLAGHSYYFVVPAWSSLR